ncbi:unnamed protein product [Arctia plantaginis]|uniref:Uncharacterized protein n=1 Tax=Arctia plantaginis TaxID=874455 RepID=A0A8S0ZPF0_ARCPL|nr:unnamed protein product [Arctia plantaginis]
MNEMYENLLSASIRAILSDKSVCFRDRHTAVTFFQPSECLGTGPRSGSTALNLHTICCLTWTRARQPAVRTDGPSKRLGKSPIKLVGSTL